MTTWNFQTKGSYGAFIGQEIEQLGGVPQRKELYFGDRHTSKHIVNQASLCIIDLRNIPHGSDDDHPVVVLHAWLSAAELIEKNLLGGRQVLVHCHNGSSRTTYALVMYFMLYAKLDYAAAKQKVVDAQKARRENDSFSPDLKSGIHGSYDEWMSANAALLSKNKALEFVHHNEQKLEVLPGSWEGSQQLSGCKTYQFKKAWGRSLKLKPWNGAAKPTRSGTSGIVSPVRNDVPSPSVSSSSVNVPEKDVAQVPRRAYSRRRIGRREMQDITERDKRWGYHPYLHPSSGTGRPPGK